MAAEIERARCNPAWEIVTDVWTSVDKGSFYEELAKIISVEVIQADYGFWDCLTTTVARKDVSWERLMTIKKEYCLHGGPDTSNNILGPNFALLKKNAT
jgi:hypothetical protein